MESLPLEIYERIFVYLDIRSILNLSKTNHHFKTVVESCPIIWHIILHRIIPGCDLSRHDKLVKQKRLLAKSQDADINSKTTQQSILFSLSSPSPSQLVWGLSKASTSSSSSNSSSSTSTFSSSLSFTINELNSNGSEPTSDKESNDMDIASQKDKSIVDDKDKQLQVFKRKRNRSIYEQEQIVMKQTSLDVLKALSEIMCKECLNMMSYCGKQKECSICLKTPDELVITRSEAVKDYGLGKITNSLTPVSKTPMRFRLKDVLRAIHVSKKGGIINFAGVRKVKKAKMEEEERKKAERRKELTDTLNANGIYEMKSLNSISYIEYGIPLLQQCLADEIQIHEKLEQEKKAREALRIRLQKQLDEKLEATNLQKYSNFCIVNNYLEGTVGIDNFMSIIKRIEFLSSLPEYKFQEKLVEIAEKYPLGVPWEEGVESKDPKILRKVESCYYICIRHVENMIAEKLLDEKGGLGRFGQQYNPPNEVFSNILTLITRKSTKKETIEHQNNRKVIIKNHLTERGVFNEELFNDENIIKMVKSRGSNLINILDEYIERKSHFENLIRDIDCPRIYFDLNVSIRFYLESGMPAIDSEAIQHWRQEFNNRLEHVRDELQRFNITIGPDTLQNPFIAEYISNGGSVDKSILNYVSHLPYKPKCEHCSRTPGKGCNKSMCSNCCEEDSFKTLNFCSLHIRLYLSV